MKTIDERADVYCQEHAYQGGYDLEDVRAAHISGAEAEHEELTRWHDPKEELPKKHRRVLLKVRKNSYVFIEVGSLQATDRGVGFIFSNCDDCKVIGWREIHE